MADGSGFALQLARTDDMKPGLSVTLAAGICALAMRLVGAESLADLAAVAYLTSATIAFGRPLSKPFLTTHS